MATLRSIHAAPRRPRPARTHRRTQPSGDAHAEAGRRARLLPRPPRHHAAAGARGRRAARHALRRTARNDPAAHLPAPRRAGGERRHAAAGARLLPRRRLDDRRPRHARRALPPALQRLGRGRRLGRLPHGARAPLSGRGRRLPRRDVLGAPPGARARRRPGAARGRRRQRRRQPRRGRRDPARAMPATWRSRTSCSSTRRPTCGAAILRTRATAAATC